MSGFLLDTNVTSELVRPRPEPMVLAWLAAQRLDSLYLSVVTIGELRKGITILPTGKRRADLEVWLTDSLLPLFGGRILPISEAIAQQWGLFEGQRQLAGRPISVPDAQIAATAIVHNLVIVTRNVKDFSGFGVGLFNPWQG